MTSLDMSGFNLNILKLDEEILICLDASTNAPNWPTLCKSQVTGYDINSISLYLAAKEDADFDSEQKEQVDAACDPTINAVLKAITNACQALIANEVQLNELDTLAGDGDCGSTIKRGATDILDKCETWKALSIDKILLNIASSAEETMGGASGGLYSLFFTAAAGLAKDLNMATICDCLQAGVNAVSKYGGAEPGDRTMLDALTAAHSSLQNQIKKKSSPKEVAKVVSKACCDAAESTANMKARAGRASYVASNLLAKPDAGAVAVSIWIEAFAKTLAV
uniref:Triokinase/FMN cyclase n=1 Tax=Phallusia mammillata TaxID=59560 RepID=A0A6F9DVB8_9ASCI|nr:triokinase/FMN cyclase-like [Phallusia mammillata]